MSGIIKHTFIPKRIVLDEITNEPKVIEETPITFYFSLLQQGHQIFEELFGKGIMSVIADINTGTNKIASTIKNKEAKKKLMEKEMQNNVSVMNLVTNNKFITSLAAASYIKIAEDGSINNTMLTATEFLENPVTNNMITDVDFSQKLIEMLASSLPQEKSATNKAKEQTKNRKK